MMHFVCTVSIMRAYAYCYEEVRNYKKILFIQNIVENGWWGDAYAAYPTSPPESAPGCIITKHGLKFKRYLCLKLKIQKAVKAQLL